MPRSLWTGSITFGLLNIPVKLYPAIRTKDVHFHLLHPSDKMPLRQKLVSSVSHKEVARTEALRGYEYAKNRMVVVEDEEFQSLMPKATHEIELSDFVPLESVDSMFFHQPYYLLPEARAGKAYHLLLKAMIATKKCGIGTFVMKNKQHLAALRPVGSVICLETMYYQDEIVSPGSYEEVPRPAAVSPKELKMAEQLIDSLSGAKFDPKQYKDEYRQKMLGLIQKKAKGKKIVVPEPEPKTGPKVVDLMSALKASLRETEKKKKHAA